MSSEKSRKLLIGKMCLGLLLLLASCTTPNADSSAISRITSEPTIVAQEDSLPSKEQEDNRNLGNDFHFEEAEGCRRPTEDYGIAVLNGHLLNQRTLEMLNYVYSLYGGKIDIRGPAITQGSFSVYSEESYFTHAGGGAVDISVYDQSGARWVLLEDEIEPLITAMRIAGFAAWYRPNDALSPGSPAHIHAIAIGDRSLSAAALNQLDGVCGYFNGLAGWPIPQAECAGLIQPILDNHGGPVVCEWMCDLGYASLADDLRCKRMWGEQL